jgi:hypothetical protein
MQHVVRMLRQSNSFVERVSSRTPVLARTVSAARSAMATRHCESSTSDRPEHGKPLLSVAPMQVNQSFNDNLLLEACMLARMSLTAAAHSTVATSLSRSTASSLERVCVLACSLTL